MVQFRLSPLRGDRILQAFPLVCAAGVDISIEDWRAYVKSMLSARVRAPDCADIIGICSPNKYLRGLFTYMVKPDLHHGCVMEVEYFVVASVYSPYEIAEALMVGVEDEARRQGCKTIHAQTPAGADWLSDMLEKHDYRFEASLWCKRYG